MFIVLSVQGCLPYIEIYEGNDGEALLFDTHADAKIWAKRNCAWEYYIVNLGK